MAKAAPDVACAWLVDKPAGPTSHDVVATVRRGLARRTRVGHTGTLDPFATGLLVILAGRATRLARYLTGLPKTYRAVIRLGERSATGDPEGPITPGGAVPGIDDITHAITAMHGSGTQQTPAYSAVKVDGERLYAKARRGDEIVAPKRAITVHSIEMMEYDASRREVGIDMCVSSGTYVRQIAVDIGEKLGCGAYCKALRRTAIAHLNIDGAVAPEDAATCPPVPLAAVLGHLPLLTVTPEIASRIGSGIAITADDDLPNGDVAVICDGDLVAVADHTDGSVRPRVVLHGAQPTAVLRA